MIKVSSLFEHAGYKFSGAGPRFTNIFTDAVNRVSGDVLLYLGIDVPDIINIQEEINIDSKTFTAMYHDGIRMYMQESGEWAREPDPEAERKYKRAVAKAVSLYFDGKDAVVES